MKKIKFLKMRNIITLESLLLLSVVLSQYNLFNLPVMYWILLIAVVLKVFLSKNDIYVYKPLLTFLAFIILHQTLILSRISYGVNSVINTILESILVTMITIILGNYINKDRLFNSYTIIGTIFMIPIFVQSIQVYGLGMNITPINVLPFFTTDNPQWFTPINRPMGIFVEPEAFATFILPMLYLCMEKKKIVLSIVITISILLSTSSLGIIMGGFIWMWFIKKNNIKNYKKILLYSFIVFGLILITQIDVFQYAIHKISSINIKDNARLSQGFMIWSQMDSRDIFTGIGRKSLVDYIMQNGIWLDNMLTASGSHKWSYVTSISGALIYYGIFGALLYYWVLAKMLTDKKANLSFMALCIILMSFGRTMLFNSTFIYWYTLYFSLANKKSNRNYFILKNNSI